MTIQEAIKVMLDNPYKTTYVHLADIRCTDIPEQGYNR